MPGAGYRGRKAIAELLILNDEMRELITSRADPHAQGHRGEERHALPARGRVEAVRRGQTTLEEINRVTFVA